MRWRSYQGQSKISTSIQILCSPILSASGWFAFDWNATCLHLCGDFSVLLSDIITSWITCTGAKFWYWILSLAITIANVLKLNLCNTSNIWKEEFLEDLSKGKSRVLQGAWFHVKPSMDLKVRAVINSWIQQKLKSAKFCEICGQEIVMGDMWHVSPYQVISSMLLCVYVLYFVRWLNY